MPGAFKRPRGEVVNYSELCKSSKEIREALREELIPVVLAKEGAFYLFVNAHNIIVPTYCRTLTSGTLEWWIDKAREAARITHP